MRRILNTRLRHKVIITLKDGSSFSGVLFDADRDAFVLRNAEAHDPNPRSAAVPVDGEVLVLRADVSYMQIP